MLSFAGLFCSNLYHDTLPGLRLSVQLTWERNMGIAQAHPTNGVHRNIVSSSPTISEYLLEVRYKPNAKVLDYRGTWAEAISDYMQLSHWQITQDRIDIFNEEQSTRAYVGFRNSGYLVRNPTTQNYFFDQARKLFRFLFDSLGQGFGTEIFVERIGVRGRTLTPVSSNFEELVKLYNTGYLQLSPKAQEMLDAEIVDIGGPVNFKDQYGNFNTTSGPMKRGEMGRFFNFIEEEEFPEVGLYIDIDYWQRPKQVFKGDALINLIRALAQQVQNRNQEIKGLILES